MTVSVAMLVIAYRNDRLHYVLLFLFLPIHGMSSEFLIWVSFFAIRHMYDNRWVCPPHRNCSFPPDIASSALQVLNCPSSYAAGTYPCGEFCQKGCNPKPIQVSLC